MYLKKRKMYELVVNEIIPLVDVLDGPVDKMVYSNYLSGRGSEWLVLYCGSFRIEFYHSNNHVSFEVVNDDEELIVRKVYKSVEELERGKKYGFKE